MQGLLVLAFCVVADAPTARDDVDMRCGAYCLYVSLKAIGLPVSKYTEIEGKLGPPSPTGYSLGQLADVAEQYGAHTLGVVTTPDNLARRSRPFACIARLGTNHFVNIADTAQGTATIIDAPRRYNLPLDVLQADWDGTALLVSTNELAQEEDLTPKRWARSLASIVIALSLVAGAALILWQRRRSAA